MTAQMIERITKDYYSHFCGIDLSSSKCGTYFICSAERDEKLRGFGCKYAIHILVNGSLCVVSYSPKHRALIEQLKKCGGDEIILAVSRHFSLKKMRLMMFEKEIVTCYGNARILKDEDYPLYAAFFRAYSAMVSGAIDYVDRNFQKNITLGDICSELLVSTGHFSKCFKRETGAGFAAYVTMVKMENARILLKNPKNRVNEVARMLGYSDYAYFFQVFKKQFGYAPSDIKANAKKDKEDKEHDSDAGE